MKLLLIEDDERCAELIVHALTGLTQTIDITDKLAEAMRIMSGEYDAIWLDLSLADSRSEETLAAIPSIREKCPKATLLVVSGYGDKFRKEALELGADAYASKIDLEGFKYATVVNLLVKAATRAMERGVDSSFILRRVASYIETSSKPKAE